MGPNHAVPILSPLEQTGTTLPPSAYQAQENSTQASTASQKQQSKNESGPQNPEKTYFSNTQKTSAKLSVIFLLLLLAFFFKRHSLLSCYSPTPLCPCSVSPQHPTCCLPRTSTIASQLVGANLPTNKHLSSCS